MAFQTGNKHGKGRPPGSTNKVNKNLRDFFQKVIEDNQERILEDLAALEPRDRIKCIIDISNYVLPRLKAVESTSILDNLSDDDLDRIIYKLKNGEDDKARQEGDY